MEYVSEIHNKARDPWPPAPWERGWKGKKGGGKGPKGAKRGTSWYVITSTITITIHDP